MRIFRNGSAQVQIWTDAKSETQLKFALKLSAWGDNLAGDFYS